jgi:hypothetical protein
VARVVRLLQTVRPVYNGEIQSSTIEGRRVGARKRTDGNCPDGVWTISKGQLEQVKDIGRGKAIPKSALQTRRYRLNHMIRRSPP